MGIYASYMKVAANNLQKKYKKMIHMIFLAHGLHLVVSEIPHILKEANAVVMSNKINLIKVLLILLVRVLID